MKKCKKMMPFAAAGNRRTIKSCREAGIEQMWLGVSNLEGHACAAADALSKTTVHINELPSLPLAECDAEACGCFWTAALPEEPKENHTMNPPPIPNEDNDTPANPKAMGWAILIVLIAVGLLLLANNKNLSKVPPEPTAVESYHATTPEAAALIAQGERDGLMLLEPENKRAFIAAGVWNGGDAQRKETLVNMLAMECARRRGDQSIRIDVLDKQSGKTLASLSQWDGLKFH